MSTWVLMNPTQDFHRIFKYSGKASSFKRLWFWTSSIYHLKVKHVKKRLKGDCHDCADNFFSRSFKWIQWKWTLTLMKFLKITAPPSLPSQCVDVGPRRHPIAPGSREGQGRGGGAAARGQCTGGCAKQWWPGASVLTRLVWLLLARDRLSGDSHS